MFFVALCIICNRQDMETTWVTIYRWMIQFSSVQSLSCVWLFAIPWIAARQASLSITNSWSSPKLMCIESVMPSSHFILCCPLLLLPSTLPASGSVPMSQLFALRWPKYWSFSLSFSHSNEQPRLVSFRMDWLDLLAVREYLINTCIYTFSSVQSLIHIQLFATPWTAACQASLSITNSWACSNSYPLSLGLPSNKLILCCHILLQSSIFPSIRVFSNEKWVLPIRWPKYWNFSFSIHPSSENSELISFTLDWLDLLDQTVQGTLKSFLQCHSLKASILWHSAFFMVQHSHPYLTTGKTIALTIWTFIWKVMSLLFNMMSKFVIAFLSRSKGLLIS